MLTKTVRVEVTQEDIDHGVRQDCEDCPVALAIIRATDIHPSQIDVDRATVGFYAIDGSLNTDEFIEKVDLPLEACMFISNFDRAINDPLRTTPQPFTFYLEVPAEVLPC